MEFGSTSLAAVARLRRGTQTRRWSSYDTTGGNADNWPIAAGQTVTLGETTGAGCIRHIWMTTTEKERIVKRLSVISVMTSPWISNGGWVVSQVTLCSRASRRTRR